MLCEIEINLARMASLVSARDEELTDLKNMMKVRKKT